MIMKVGPIFFVGYSIMKPNKVKQNFNLFTAFEWWIYVGMLCKIIKSD